MPEDLLKPWVPNINRRATLETLTSERWPEATVMLKQRWSHPECTREQMVKEAIDIIEHFAFAHMVARKPGRP